MSSVAQIVNIRPLRMLGERVADPPDAIGGCFRVSNQAGRITLAVVGPQSGRVLLGPILDPTVVAAEPDGFVLQGLECAEGGERLQEWLVVLAKPNPAPPDLPLW